MDDSSSDSSGDESEFLASQDLKYRKALAKFINDRKTFEDAIPAVSQLPWKQRVQFVENGFEKILFGLHDRPKRVKMGRIAGDIDELEVFCSAICIGWKLCPDCWIGLQMMLDYLGEGTLPEDIVRVDMNTLRILKEIALCTEWKNNPKCGNMSSSQAKCIIVRRFKDSSLPDRFHVMLMSMGGCISPKGSKTAGLNDFRRICNGIDCYEVEYSKKFKVCGRCKKVVYCSKNCQVKSWRKGHKQDCAN